MTDPRASTGRRWRNRPPVRERDEHRVRWLWSVLLAMCLVALPAGAYLVCQNQCLKLSYELNALKTAHERLLEDERTLKVERARLGSLARVETWARRECGLVHPAEGTVFVLPRMFSEPASLVALGRGAPAVLARGDGPARR